jgi:hypothetical protein
LSAPVARAAERGLVPLRPFGSAQALARDIAMGAAMACAWNARQMAPPAPG